MASNHESKPSNPQVSSTANESTLHNESDRSKRVHTQLSTEDIPDRIDDPERSILNKNLIDNNPKKKGSFQITSVKITDAVNRQGIDGESLDELEESHTEDLSSELLDCSKNTDYDHAETPSDETIALTDHSHGPTPTEESKVELGLTQSRFKVVKIESKEPFRRGRWSCFDFLDPPVVDKGDSKTDVEIGSGSSSASSSIHYVHGVDDPSKNPLAQGFLASPVLIPGATENIIVIPQVVYPNNQPITETGQTPGTQSHVVSHGNQNGNVQGNQQGNTPANANKEYPAPTPTQIPPQTVPSQTIQNVHQNLPPTQMQGGQQVQPQVQHSGQPGAQNGHGQAITQPQQYPQTVPQQHVPIQQQQQMQQSGQQLHQQQQNLPVQQQGNIAQHQQNAVQQPNQTSQSIPQQQHTMQQGAQQPPPVHVPHPGTTTQKPQGTLPSQSASMPSQTSAPQTQSSNQPVSQQAQGQTLPSHDIGNNQAQPSSDASKDVSARGSDLQTPASDVKQPPKEANSVTTEGAVSRPENLTAGISQPMMIDVKEIAAQTASVLTPPLLEMMASSVSAGPLSPTKEEDGEGEESGSASTVAIDNKIEQAMDLVKSHLMFAVREEVEVLKEQIKELIQKNNQLEYENNILKDAAPQEVLNQLKEPMPTQQPPQQQPPQQPPPSNS